ncbi:MAG: fused MFS/spermidine synthase [bacterium]
MKKNARISQLILTLFFLSGFCGLLYEITWTRLISIILGNSTDAISVTLAAFMGGMAIGGYAGGKAADRRAANPLRLYGILEGLVALYALFLPFVLRSTRPLLASFYQNAQTDHITMVAVRFAICFVVLVIPTALFGAMIPVLSKFLVRQFDQLSGVVGKLYGLNLLGSTLGALATGLWLIPNLGVSKTIYLAVLIECLICGWVLALSRSVSEAADAAGTNQTAGTTDAAEDADKEPAEATGATASASRSAQDAVAPERKSSSSLFILLGMALSGCLAMIYEVTWTRAVIMIIGSTVYAFSVILAAFIGGLALGSLFLARLFDKRKDLALIFGLIEIGVGGSALSLAPFFEKLSLIVIPVFSVFGTSFAALQAMELFGLFLLMLLPSLMLGALFPLLSTMYTRSISRLGGGVGSTFMANSLGAIAGVIVSGLILIPAIGIQKTILAAALINVLLGSIALLFSPSLSIVKKSVAIPLAVGCTLLLCITQPEWNKALVSGGPYIYSRIYASLNREPGKSLSEIIQSQADLLFYQEDAQTTVSVKKDKAGQVFLQLNGKTDASSKEDECTQRLLAHIPLLLHSNPREVMVLGLGSGMTISAAEKYPVEHLDCLEISPAVLKACAACFNDLNGRALEDPRLRVVIGDGREHLALTDQKYDLIISQPSSPWIAGMAGLLTRDFFQLCKERLKEHGILCIWLQTYNMDLDSSKSVVKAFEQVFPRMSVWEARPGVDYLLLGGPDGIELDYRLLQQKMADESLELKAVGLKKPVDLMARFVMNEAGVKRFAEKAIPHTDDNSFLEFKTPKFLYRENMNAQLAALNALRGVDLASLLTVVPDAEAGSLTESLPKTFEAQKHYALGEMYLLKNMQEEGARELREAYLLAPDDTRIKEKYYRLLLTTAANCSVKGMHEVAAQILQAAIKVNPDGAEGYLNLGLAYFHSSQFQAAIEQFRAALTVQPGNFQAHLNLAAAYLRTGRMEESIQENLAALQIKPDLVNAHFNLGIAYMRTNRVSQAIAEYQDALKYQPDYAEAHFNLGIAYQTAGALDQAAREYEETLRLKPDIPNVRQLLDQVNTHLMYGR